ncbi:MAG: D-2-hydroxyacid dehydrogenase family protein [Pseudomonadota bacterium]|nr:D-2-hydroxyacid dehydrogenase family protein [Pseudomonadota bacterium]
MRVAILDDYLNVALELGDWSRLDDKADLCVFDQPFADQDKAAEKLADFEIIVGMRERTPFPADLLKRLPKLKLLVTTGMRNLSFDMEAAKAQGVTVCGTGAAGQPTAELAWAILLGLACQIPAHDSGMKAGRWQTKLNGDLGGKTLGVLGLGKLGSAVAKVGLAFGMDVIAWSQNLTDERAAEVGVRRVDMDTLMSQSDYISIHLILSDRSRGLIGADDLARMKSSAYLVNTSRGPIVDEDALLKALQDRQIAGAGIDVYSVEPLPADSPFRTLDNVLLTPHMGYVATDNISKMYSDAAEDIAAFLDGVPVRVLND